MPASQARMGIRHEEGPGAAREREAPLLHSAARCRVENRTHTAQAHEAQVHGNAVHARENTSLERIGLAAQAGSLWWRPCRPKGSSTHSSEDMPTSEHAMELEDTMVLMTVISCWQREKPVVLMSSSSISLRHAARTRCLYARCAGCTHPLPICPLRREAEQHSVQ